MRRKAVLIAATLTASLVGAFAGVDLSRASRPVACEAETGRALTPVAAARHGDGIPAVVGGRSLVVVDGEGRRETFLPRVAGAGRGSRRDVATGVRHRVRPGSSGTRRRGHRDRSRRAPARPARRGVGSVLVVRRPAGVVARLASPALVARDIVHGRHRASSGGDRRVLAGVRDGRHHRLGGGRARAGLLANRGRGPRQPLALRSAFPPLVARHRVPRQRRALGRHQDADRAGRRLDRVRAGEGTGNRDPDARVRALADARRAASPPRCATFPREMYLAGTQDGRRIWNLYDQASGEWRLYAEASATTLVDLGCGAALVDPRSVPDPDMTPAWLDTVPTPTPRHADPDADRHADPGPHGVTDTLADADPHTHGAADDRPRSRRRLHRRDPRGRFRDPGGCERGGGGHPRGVRRERHRSRS